MGNFYELLGYNLWKDAPRYVSNLENSSSLSNLIMLIYKGSRTVDYTARVKISTL